MYAVRGSAVGFGRAELQKERKNVPCRLCSSHVHCLVWMWLALCNIVARPLLLLLNLIHPYDIHSIYLSLFCDIWDCNRWWECDSLNNSVPIISHAEETGNDALFRILNGTVYIYCFDLHFSFVRGKKNPNKHSCPCI